MVSVESIGAALSTLQALGTTVGVGRNELVAGMNRLSHTLDRDGGKEDPHTVQRLRSHVHNLRSFERNNMVDGTPATDLALQMMVCKLLSSNDQATAQFMRAAEKSYSVFGRAGARGFEQHAPIGGRPRGACYTCGGSGHAARQCPSVSAAAPPRGFKRRAEDQGPLRPAPPPPQPPPMLTWPGMMGPPRPPGGF